MYISASHYKQNLLYSLKVAFRFQVGVCSYLFTRLVFMLLSIGRRKLQSS